MYRTQRHLGTFERAGILGVDGFILGHLGDVLGSTQSSSVAVPAFVTAWAVLCVALGTSGRVYDPTGLDGVGLDVIGSL